MLGILKRIFTGGPLVSELVKLDKEAQRDIAHGLMALFYVVAGVVGLIGLIVGLGLAKWIFG